MKLNGYFSDRPHLIIAPMKIIQHAECFEVISADGAIRRQFSFDDNAGRRAITGKMTKKQAFVAAKTFAGKGHTIEPAKPG